MKFRPVQTTLVVITTTLLTACGGGDSASPNNFVAKNLQVVTADPRISYPLELSITMSAETATSNVSVSVFAVESTEDTTETVEQIPLGTQTIEQVNAGDGSYTLSVNLPSSMETTGAYYIGAVIDPIDAIGETDEEDNEASIETTISNAGNPNVKVTDLDIDRLSMLLNTDVPDSAPDALTDPASLFDQIEDVYNADAGATLTVVADGLGPNQTMDVEAYATLHMERTDTGAEYDVPLYLWYYDETATPPSGRYVDVYGVSGPVEWLPIGSYSPQLATFDATTEEADLDEEQNNSTTLNFYAPGGLGYAIEVAMRYSPPASGGSGSSTLSTPALPSTPPPDLTPTAISALASFLSGLPYTDWGDETNAMAVMDFSICVEIRPAGSAIESNVLDNKQCQPLTITLPPVAGDITPPEPPPSYTYTQVSKFSQPSGPLISDDGYGTKGGGSYFLFGPFDFGAGTSADYRGYIENIRGGIPITVAGTVYDFMSVNVKMQIVPDYNGRAAEDSSGFKFELVFLNSLIDTLSTGPVGLTDTVSYSVEAPNPPRERQVFVGPVPVVLSASVAGNIGLDLAFVFEGSPTSVLLGENTADYDQRLGGSIAPFVNVEASASAALGIAKLFSAGVEGVLSLLDERLELFVGTEIDVIKDGFQNADGVVEFIIGQGVTLTNIFTGPQGKINLFAKYSVPKLTTCKWGFVKVPCIKVKTAKATVNIYSSPALFRFEDILFESKGVELDVVLVPGEDPLYFVEP